MFIISNPITNICSHNDNSYFTVCKYAFFLDIQKAFDTVWHDGLWFRLWELDVRGRMWRVIKKMYDITESAVLLEGENPNHLI